MRFEEPSEERLHKCGVLEIDDSDRIVSMEEKPAEPGASVPQPSAMAAGMRAASSAV